MSDNKDKCMRVDCAAHIKDRKLKTNKCCKLYDDIVVQQTPHHVGPACLFLTTTPTTSIPVAELEELRADLATRPSGVYDRIQGYIRVIQEKDALIVDLVKPSEQAEASSLGELLCSQAKLIDAVWKMAAEGVEDVTIHECSATSACHEIVDKIKAVMLTGENK